MNKIVQVSRYSLDDLSGLEIVERPIPQPSAGEVLVRVHLRPVDPAGGQSRLHCCLLCTSVARGGGLWHTALQFMMIPCNMLRGPGLPVCASMRIAQRARGCRSMC